MTDLNPRQIADACLDALCRLDPILATSLGVNLDDDRLPDYSPAGADARAELLRATLDDLERSTAAGLAADPAEAQCARLLRERLSATLAQYDAGDHLRAVGNLHSPVHSVRSVFVAMPAATEADWSVIAGRLRRVPEALAGYRAALAAGVERDLKAAPRQVEAVLGQLATWLGEGEDGQAAAGAEDGEGEGDPSWFEVFAAGGPEKVRPELAEAARIADSGVRQLRDWLRDEYAPAVQGTADAVGRERYLRSARAYTGADVDLDEAYAWGWAEFHRISAEMRSVAEQILPGATALEAMTHLNEHGHAIEGAEEVRVWLQELMDQAIRDLDGTHFDLAGPIRKVEAMLAPAGSAAAPYYTAPSLDFARPGRTWLPTLGHTRFPTWGLVSTWYHEGLPGHHLQLAQWTLLADQLSRYQVTIGRISANSEGWALYAERLMDELGYLGDPAERLGFLDAQLMRAIRVIVDIGMHLELRIPQDADFHPGESWTPELARDFFGRNSGRPGEFLDSELIRYLGLPGQAIGYKLGERAWLAGREAARAAHAERGEEFDLKAWHMKALSLSPLGLDDLVPALSQL
ncbi:DUF885 domain-containing protein [Actinospica durhamensis]|uniref:DUF885 domain-containing protein n=1 Tax=Actinospica durhamensis TaxID=1508375 RepID=A0A941EN26_9ACTN|nr:DUF885 domain-containing protein [Actinospica durhamensis]MBR7834111.1 DUF885 domain-containing protein [Actinospica durhamensis]